MDKNACLSQMKDSIDLAYWVGVVQTDGYLKKQYVVNKKALKYYVGLGVGVRSLPMQKKFIEISQSFFNIRGCMSKSLSYNVYEKYDYRFGCKRLLPLFDKLDIKFSEPICPPAWVSKKPELFGAYLAGIIDGDGDISITRPRYPQCKIRISTGKKPTLLIIAIKKFLGCSVSSYLLEKKSTIANHDFFGRYFVTEFKVSKKNLGFIGSFLVDNVAIDYKRDKIKTFMNGRATVGI